MLFRSQTTRVAEGLRAEAKRLGVTEADALKATIDKIPMGRLAEADEIASMTVFAASGKASYLSGVVITMDGVSAPIVV